MNKVTLQFTLPKYAPLYLHYTCQLIKKMQDNLKGKFLSLPMGKFWMLPIITSACESVKNNIVDLLSYLSRPMNNLTGGSTTETKIS